MKKEKAQSESRKNACRHAVIVSRKTPRHPMITPQTPGDYAVIALRLRRYCSAIAGSSARR
ncbi:hypothetical protein [[Hallella] seregens]|uniref:Uncharacterized protein n=1 Tax=Hallella seregens ATCC 51272 TaxID=1336250 RepID=A0ABV5ZN18_9BACT|nr:hypothetical protein [Hallella seregens]